MLDSEVARWVDRHWPAVESMGAMPGPGPMPPWAFAAASAGGYAAARAAGLPWELACVAGLALGKAASELCWAAKWCSWAKRRAGSQPAAKMWLGARIKMAKAGWARSLMLAKLLGAHVLRRLGASWLALPLESSALSGLDGLRSRADRRSECLWALKAKFDPHRGRLECQALALALALAWGRGEMALAYASRLRHSGAGGGLSSRLPSELLSGLAWRWDSLGAGAHWRPVQGKSSLSDQDAESGAGVDSMSFAAAFDLACEAFRDSKFQPDAHWAIAADARLAYLSQLERRALADAMGETAPAPGLPGRRSGARRL